MNTVMRHIYVILIGTELDFAMYGGGGAAGNDGIIRKRITQRNNVNTREKKRSSKGGVEGDGDAANAHIYRG